MKGLWFLSFIALAVVGCQSDLDIPARMEAVVVEGKVFNIPQGAIASDHPATPQEIAYFKKSGVSDCQEGDITWEMPEAQQAVGDAIAKGDAKVHSRLAKEGLIGCAHPLR